MFFTKVVTLWIEHPAEADGKQLTQGNWTKVRYLAFELFSLPLMLLSVSHAVAPRSVSWHEQRQLPARYLKYYLGSRFTGLWLIMLALMCYTLHLYQTQQQYQQIVSSPAAGDLYFMDFSRLLDDNAQPLIRHSARLNWDLYQYPFGMARIEEVDGQVVVLRVGNIFYNYAASPQRQLRQWPYNDKSQESAVRIMVSFNQLSQWLQSGDIYAVKRPLNGQVDGLYLRDFSALQRHSIRYEKAGKWLVD
ncbi:hypothetical protein [Bowmanella denitrificans]|uniref:hypothetical protein n=1 Tax=Bowmanella denitrificans TaxID=366582 RepID=UPI000C9C9072|nr:hypothetical protein [Bowmanella denitrificans]